MAKLPASTSRRLYKRKKQILTARYKQAGFITFIIFFVVIIAAIVGIIIYSEQAKPGDLLYPVELTMENMQVSFTTINPEDRIPVLTSQSKKRILEASELSSDASKAQYFSQALTEYDNLVPEIAYELNQGRVRNRDIQSVEPLFIESLLDNLESLDKMYDQIHSDQQPVLDAAVMLTAQSYDDELSTLSQRRQDLDIAGYKERFYELQQDLRTKGVIIE